MGEAQKFVLFPNGCSMKQMTNLLGLYGGCDADELRRIRRLPSRWVCLSTPFPSLVLYEGGCYLLHTDSPSASSSKLIPPAKRARGIKAAGGAEGDDGEDAEEDAGY